MYAGMNVVHTEFNMHKRLSVLLVVSALLSIACGGPTEATDQDTRETGGGGPDDDGPIEVDSQICQDYLDCLAATEPNSLAQKEAEYGLQGSCWQNGEVERCELVCSNEHDDLFDENPHEPACGEVDLCPKDGRWEAVFGASESGCYFQDQDLDMSCVDEGTSWYFNLDSRDDGSRVWTCDGVGITGSYTCKSTRLGATAEGTFSGLYELGEGTYTFNEDGSQCYGTGPLTLVQDF